jgi:hypothetical protein
VIGKPKNFTADLRGWARIKSKGLYRKGRKERKGEETANIAVIAKIEKQPSRMCR